MWNTHQQHLSQRANIVFYTDIFRERRLIVTLISTQQSAEGLQTTLTSRSCSDESLASALTTSGKVDETKSSSSTSPSSAACAELSFTPYCEVPSLFAVFASITAVISGNVGAASIREG